MRLVSVLLAAVCSFGLSTIAVAGPPSVLGFLSAQQVAVKTRTCLLRGGASSVAAERSKKWTFVVGFRESRKRVTGSYTLDAMKLGNYGYIANDASSLTSGLDPHDAQLIVGCLGKYLGQ